ncbi:hypothetical protein SeMB42_g07035 [Synchytrium endobioticum]|uniref:DUF2470 domain-containing protein n=1 Tax=Synchytrium endobioticum TaxID=286115 RepID=A0A507CBF9_9FUNG|nr:hypothetical protein SeMB42_g07037 [Synchytrium endobioticum]TPX36811.1 hypothetical protein SeMB42_g07035 [Synchytrium endobioticum]TPX38847.1 hypothetical protein SeLEV6574_g07581 [Synchytrium endobioticum]
MASLRKRAGKDPISAFSAEICAHMNTSHADSVEAYARHFAAASAVYGARMAGIDADGFTVEYRETRDGPARDVRIQFDTPLASHEHARAVLVRMADEAVKAVGMDVSRGGRPNPAPRGAGSAPSAPAQPEQKNGPYWMQAMELPTAGAMIPYVAVWVVAVYGAYGPPLPPTNRAFTLMENWRHWAGGPEIFARCVVALSALHALEAVVCIVIGMWSRVHPVVIVWYALSTLVFGVSALKMMTKASITEAGRHNETGLGGLTVFDWLGINTDMVPDSFVNFEEDDEQPQIAEVVDDEDEDEVIVRK